VGPEWNGLPVPGSVSVRASYTCCSMPPITVYTTDPCSFCARTKGILKARNIEFVEVNLSKDPVGRAELARKTGMMSFPQVMVDGKLIGGFAELHAAVEDGSIDDLLPA
jgi:glutaredoxin 3